MKRILIVIALSGLTIACDSVDPETPKMWRRAVEPWLSGNPTWQQCKQKPLKADQLIPEMQCGAEAPRTKTPCDEFIATHEEAREQLVTAPHCIEEIIETLKRFSVTSPEALSDLAAAHYVRAQREDEPSHLLHALYAADQAVNANRQSPAARFNLALIQQAVSFHAQAVESWDAVLSLDGSSPWAGEARNHREEQKRLMGQNAQLRWEHTKKRLNAALGARDGTAVRRLIDDFPSAVYDRLDPMLGDRPDDARVLAGPLSERLDGDPDPLDRVSNPTASAPAKLLAAAINAQQTASRENATEKLVLLDDIAAQARARHYHYLGARIQWFRALILADQGRYIEALTAYQAAHDVYKRLRDHENLVAVQTRIAGIYTATGAAKRAWREEMRAGRLLHHLRAARYRHAYFGEAAKAVRAFGFPELALIYQAMAADELQPLLDKASDTDRPELLMNTVIALRERAALELQLDRRELAGSHLRRAADLAREHSNDKERQILEVRLAEVRGQALLQADPGGANEAFTTSIQLATSPTHRAELYAQRARARLNLNDTPAALEDLKTAFALLREEQQNMLVRRTREEGAEIWSAYFSRYRETYDLLMEKTLEDEQPAVAFSYNERARAAEPINLLQQFDLLPADLRRRYETNTLGLAYIQDALPAGTFILQYAVLKDCTYLWILSHELSVVTELPVTRDDVTAWTRALQRAAERNDDDAFEKRLAAPYGALFDYALKKVHQMNGKRGMPRIVIVPDGPMHGLPFAALRNTKEKRYLLEEAIVEIAGSTALYLVSLERNRALTAAAPSLLLIGNPRLSDGLTETYELVDLPHAEEEADEIARQYASEPPVTGPDATPARFLSLAPGHSIIHFAGHAIVNEQEPHRSFLALAGDANDTGELDAQELLTQVKLDRTRLVVLSTCRSAAGAPVGLEGVAPLVRPFIGTGVPAVVGSLWDVDDATTRDLLVSFHRHYRNGKDAAAALQAAQLDQLSDRENPGRQPALAWGSFQVIGHASSPFPPPASMKKEKPP